MKKVTKTISSHLIIQLVYSLVLFFILIYEDIGNATPRMYYNVVFMFYLAIAILIHCIVGIILAVRAREKDASLSKAHWLACLLVLLMGASICFSAPLLIG